jgi:hypothetical protein
VVIRSEVLTFNEGRLCEKDHTIEGRIVELPVVFLHT